MLKNRFGNRPAAIPCGLAIWLLLLLVPSLIAQTAGMGALTGRIVDSSGNPVANATVTVTSVENGQARSATTGTDGSYRFDDLPPGSYRMKLEAAGFQTLEIPSATVDGTKPSVVDEMLQVSAPTTTKPTLEQQDNLPNAPSSSTVPSLSDLGLTPEQTQGNPREQALLDKRTHMLKIHQRMGLITTLPLVATLILGPGAGGKSE
ncbi:MAG TPA: carboxypeptidase-like regulatory domain-containing protein, partial [Acidobacteriaceae bacterium]